MIDVKTAAQTSADYLRAFFPDASKIQLEEMELAEDKKFWYLTLSYEEPSIYPSLAASQKFLKQFKIDSASGEVVSMKIRKV